MLASNNCTKDDVNEMDSLLGSECTAGKGLVNMSVQNIWFAHNRYSCIGDFHTM